ncbi:Protein-lysine N-methyltransferase efm4 [Tieghemiomyces parasiticus]|uniref:Protein-lysine N-methyltransferase efm4 n=1 Tax=Tieghemiomyces parasiticus TaxID=78921 RepID=A0A9W8DS37_9FUNG|nr:Protein-lysine N-methyltransferase efm4 [Tieghemiomyces parasiticus]
MADTSATPAHHNPKGGFINPWPSHQHFGFLSVLMAMVKDWNIRTSLFLPDEKTMIPVLPMATAQLTRPDPTQLQLTWLGHASFLLQANGLNILFDPVFSERCSFVQFAGPKRVRPTPCKVEDLPPIDLVVISHNHYDHMDVNTIRSLGPKPVYCVPLGNKAWLEDLGVTNIREMDWWDEADLQLGVAADTTSPLHGVKVVCTPCQHFTGRSLTDRYRTLWASFCLLFPNGQRFYFAGDTGYRTVRDRAHELTLDTAEDTTPVCPAFREIGERYGPFDLSCIPIGAYSPRWVFSPVHCSPEDAVRLHEDVRSKKSVGMHWGTFILTDEPLTEPPQRLAKALAQRGHTAADFCVMDIGAMLTVPASTTETTVPAPA